MHLPEVSIIIPAFNAEKHIERTLRSCINQTFEDANYEIIVVNDGSTDNTKRICMNYWDYIRYIECKTNKGLPSALNLGIKQAYSRYVVRVDSDDYIHEDFVKILYLILSLNNNIHAAACDYFIVDEQEMITTRANSRERPIGCGIMFRKDSLVEIGLYDEDFLMAEEVELKIRFEKRWPIERVKIPLYRYLKHEHNMTNNHRQYDKFIKRAKKKNSK